MGPKLTRSMPAKPQGAKPSQVCHQATRSARQFHVHLLFALVVMLSGHMTSTEARSRLIEPPSRPSLWRYGFGTAVNFDDEEVNCGGFDVSPASVAFVLIHTVKMPLSAHSAVEPYGL